MRSLKLALPQRLPARLTTIQHACPEGAFDSNPASCPKASVTGSVIVQSPILWPMAGPAYLVAKEAGDASGASAFPDMVFVLQEQGVTIDLSGRVYVNGHNVTSLTFPSIPDIPIRRLELTLPEGKRSILVAGSNLCNKAMHISGAIAAQNGAEVKHSVTVTVTGCKRENRRHPKSKRPAARR